jgi:hypothetical protein
MAGLLTYLIRGEIDQSIREIDGTILTRPTLLVTDGLALTYGCDVDVGIKTLDSNTGDEVVTPLRNVPIAANSRNLIYSDAGTAVRLRRSETGRWEVIGLSKRRPGTYTRIPVHIPDPSFGPIPYDVGPAAEVGLVARALTYDELATFGGYGVVPYGATGIFRDGVLIELR